MDLSSLRFPFDTYADTLSVSKEGFSAGLVSLSSILKARWMEESSSAIHSISFSCENGVQCACVMSGEISSTDPTESQNPPGSDSDKSHSSADRTREGRSRNCPSRLFAAIWIRSPLLPSSPALLSPLPFRWRRKWGLSRRLRRRCRLCVRELLSYGVPLPYLSVPSPPPPLWTLPFHKLSRSEEGGSAQYLSPA